MKFLFSFYNETKCIKLSRSNNYEWNYIVLRIKEELIEY